MFPISIPQKNNVFSKMNIFLFKDIFLVWMNFGQFCNENDIYKCFGHQLF